MCRAWCLDVWIAARAKSALGMPMASLVVPGVAGAEDSQLGQQATLPLRAAVELPASQRASLALFAREGRLCPQADKRMRRRSSEWPYHRPQARRLQRDVQLTGPLAMGESLGDALEMVVCHWRLYVL